MVATVLTFLTSSKHVQPDEQLLHMGLQNTGANQVQIIHFLENYSEMSNTGLISLITKLGNSNHHEISIIFDQIKSLLGADSSLLKGTGLKMTELKIQTKVSLVALYNMNLHVMYSSLTPPGFLISCCC